MSTSDRSGAQPKGWTLLWLILALAGGVAWLIVLFEGGQYQRAWRSLLINFLFFSSLSGGLAVWPAVARSCNARWQLGIEHLAGGGMMFSLPSLIALIVLWIGSPGWSPWYGAELNRGIWLANWFIFARDLAALALFWWLAFRYLRRRDREEGRILGPVLVLVYSLVFSLLGFDLVMSLDPQWHSNLAGGYFFMSGLYIGITTWSLLAAQDPEATVEQRHDLGKLTVAFSLMTTYLMFAHLLLFWYENLPHEIRFLVPRMHIPAWKGVSFLLVGLVYFGPLVLLLTERSKRNRWSLGIISLLVLVGLWIERWWLVAPTFESRLELGLSELSLAASFLGLFGLGLGWYRRRLPFGEN